MARIVTAAVAPVSYLEEPLGFASSSVTFGKSLALPTSSRSAGAPVAPAWGCLAAPHRPGLNGLWHRHLLSSLKRPQKVFLWKFIWG